MRRVLIVKTSSMGDVIHTLPALTDAKRALVDIEFDWVVEEGFAEVPSWHPAVDRVIPVAIRRWRKNLLQSWRSSEWRQFRTELRKRHYDLVIDAQGLLKSAWITRFVKAPTAGMDRHSVREPLATWAYRYKYPVAKAMHAVERTRLLFAQALGYELPKGENDEPLKGDYGVDPHRFYGSTPAPANVVFLHATTRDDKHYPEPYWRQLAAKLTAEGYRVRLPWGAAHEHARAQRIAQGIDGVEVLPRLNLQGVAGILAQASAVIAVDTGLGHLSAALNIPTISLYGPTSPALVGAYGENQIHLCASMFSTADEVDAIKPAVFAPMTPVQVYGVLLEKILAERAPLVGGA